MLYGYTAFITVDVNNPPVRRIAHVDMDAFYASVELLRYPELRGKAVVIGGGSNAAPELQADGTRRFAKLRDYAGRGVVTTSTYEARAFGVFSAMGMMKAAQLAPDAILLPTDFESYRRYSRLFKDAVRTFTDRIEDRGIDEIYVDLTHVEGESRALGLGIKNAVREATGLTCSIAIAPNKLLAKIGSELDKPDGLTILSLPDLESRIWPLAAKKINGIGPRANERLAALGILTVGDLARADLGLLQENFGRTYAAWLARIAHGVDDREVVVSSEPKSMSRETTFERDMHVGRDRAILTPALTRLCERVTEDLQRKGYRGRTVGLKIKFADFKIVTRDLSLPEPVADTASIRRAVGECLKRVSLDRRIRLIGVRIGSLERATGTPSAPLPLQGELPFDR
ncbi:DNA polymerase IV [Paraburkholderia sp. J76]|uniref:DNA polymerase IV n=1 Tax=Paraburkholderia sp. J76 TaxID=2805439 RepID=UPI002ABE5BE8|nr:DNA polymerase IV [Paraburkholderia sp. J76]